MTASERYSLTLPEGDHLPTCRRHGLEPGLTMQRGKGRAIANLKTQFRSGVSVGFHRLRPSTTTLIWAR